MTHAEAFLHDICEHPDDDGPRLVFADWLDDNGQPERAEFIRLQCALAGSAPSGEQRRHMKLREDLLLVRHGGEWALPVRRLVQVGQKVQRLGSPVQFHRGFVGEVWVFAQVFLARADRLFRIAPVQHLHLWGQLQPIGGLGRDGITVPRLVACPHLGRLVLLDLGGNALGSDGVGALVVGEHFGRLRGLSLVGNAVGDGGVRALCNAPLLGQLTSLDLRYNEIGSAGLRCLVEALQRLAERPEGLRLREVHLAGNPFPAAARRLVRSPLLRGVVRLE